MAEQAYVVSREEWLAFEAFRKSQGEVQLLGAMQALVLTSPSPASAKRKACKLIDRLCQLADETAPPPVAAAEPVAPRGMMSERRRKAGLAPGSLERTRKEAQPSPSYIGKS